MRFQVREGNSSHPHFNYDKPKPLTSFSSMATQISDLCSFFSRLIGMAFYPVAHTSMDRRDACTMGHT